MITHRHYTYSGWVHHGIDNPETVASHMYRMALLGIQYSIFQGYILFIGKSNGIGRGAQRLGYWEMHSDGTSA